MKTLMVFTFGGVDDYAQYKVELFNFDELIQSVIELQDRCTRLEQKGGITNG